VQRSDERGIASHERCGKAARSSDRLDRDETTSQGNVAIPVAWRQAVDDRDYLIRTIAFEASGEPAMAKIAVAYVVLNRKKSGKWGDNIKAVVTQPGQFEPWTTRRREIEGLSPDDPSYQSAAIIADAVLSGQTPDPTGGATHFLNPTIVRERRGGALPSWARGEGLPIGSHGPPSSSAKCQKLTRCSNEGEQIPPNWQHQK
jgi:spore germination cell wall hydrolase CwlJ-like protein